MTEMTKQRPLTEQEEFEAKAITFGQVLLATSRTWAGHRHQMNDLELKDLIDTVEKCCYEMVAAIDKLDKRSVRELTTEEFEKKVEAGKKIMFAKEGERMKKGDNSD